MDNLEGSENNAKISDSAYSTSCSNSQSRRSHSSKSTHSGSHSSGSSGYGGKPSTYSNNSGQPGEEGSKDKDAKKKKQVLLEKTTEVDNEVEGSSTEQAPITEAITEEIKNLHSSPQHQTQAEKPSHGTDQNTAEISSYNDDEVMSCNTPVFSSTTCNLGGSPSPGNGFSCVISMHDGVVMYTTTSLTTTLGFPREMWIGRSFIDFVHPKDHTTFASHITTGFTIPKSDNNANGGGNSIKPAGQQPVCTMVCRIRKYRSISSSFGVKERAVKFMPFLLKLSFKDILDEEGKVIYLVIQAAPLFSAFKTPNEVLSKPAPFTIRHAANGNVEHVDMEAVPYLGYLPQDLIGKDAIQLYHPDDLMYLRQVYETIVREGTVLKSKSFRMMTQNGDYITVETEWCSFINPWSRKLEFVLGTHHIIQGPYHPAVFETPVIEKPQKVDEEEKLKISNMRESIIRVLNEVLTKPAEVAKQQMSKRCQVLASFMESLIENHPKVEEELHVVIQDPDNSYYERDSVMLGGISPHHEHNDSKSSTETQLSYNQLNYNETLERFFKSHQPASYEEQNSANGKDNIHGLVIKKPSRDCLSPMGLMSRDSGDLSSCDSGESSNGYMRESVSSLPPPRLTEALIIKHNVDMEKELLKKHYMMRPSSKKDKEQVESEKRKKRKEHLARCNATFQPTALTNISDPQALSRPREYRSSKKNSEKTNRMNRQEQSSYNTTCDNDPHGVKRGSKQVDSSDSGKHKHHCSSSRQSRKKKNVNLQQQPPFSTVTTSVAAGNWCHTSGNSVNAVYLEVGFPQQMPIVSSMSAAMIPMYYASAAPGLPIDCNNRGEPSTSSARYQPPMQCMMYEQTVYGSPLMYSPINASMMGPFPHIAQQPQQNPCSSQFLGLNHANYEAACVQTMLTPTPHVNGLWCTKQIKKLGPNKTDNTFNATRTCSLSNTNNQSTNTQDSLPCQYDKKSEDNIDPTDGESSYSSFYRTDTGSAEESRESKHDCLINKSNVTQNKTHYNPPAITSRRKIDPPWTEHLCVTSELVYRYQIHARNITEVLKSDELKIRNFIQPSLVNEQLEQLYVDMQLEGVAGKLTLEEGITSSSSSGEETMGEAATKSHKRREQSKLVMIFEEDAPLPPPISEQMPPPPQKAAS